MWVTVSNQLAEERISVPAEVLEAQEAGDEALAEELQTRRNLVMDMDASFLRASLFTSVVSFGVSAPFLRLCTVSRSGTGA